MANTPQKQLRTHRKRIRRVLLLLGAQYQHTLEGVFRYAQEHHWVVDVSYARVGRVQYCPRLDGIIGLITTPRDLEQLRQLPPAPLVDLSAAWGTEALPDNGGANVPRVLYDNVGIARLAADHFIGRGFVNIAFLNVGNYWHERERRPVFRETVERAGRTFHELEHYRWQQEENVTNTIAAEERVLRRLERELQQLPKPLAVFAPSDDMAALVLQVCEEAGLHVPEEVAVLGCHNDPFVCEFTSVKLSSVDDDLVMQGYEAARLLDRLIDGEPAPESPLIIPPKGVATRNSTNILAVPHRQVATALRYIWEHYTEPIQTDDVVAAAALSPRHLARLFEMHLGRSVAAEITRKRIERAKELLTKTNLKAWQVAEQAGFSSMEHLSKAFTRIVEENPSRFREHHRQS